MTDSQFSPTTIAVREEHGVTIVTLETARLSEETTLDETTRELDQALAQSTQKKLIIDLHLVQWMNSAALGRLVTLHRRIHRDGGRMILAAPTTEVASVLRMSRLQDYFSLCPTVDTAIALLQPT